jgi:hypothetical protein
MSIDYEAAIAELQTLAKKFDKAASANGVENAVDRVAISILKVGAVIADRLDAIAMEMARRPLG